jgi:hypothetical protein
LDAGRGEVVVNTISNTLKHLGAASVVEEDNVGGQCGKFSANCGQLLWGHESVRRKMKTLGMADIFKHKWLKIPAKWRV